MKTRELTLIGTILAVSALSIPMIISETSPKPEMINVLLNDNENPELLEKILDYCNSTDVKQSPVMALSNGTHIITNDTCEWQTIEKYESDGMLNFIQSNCEHDIRPIEDPTPWSNTTHYIDTDSCKWMVNEN